MNIPAELKFSKSHEWVKMDGDVAVIGISDFAQDALGDVVFINLPAEGDSVTAGESFGDVESVKAVSDVICPVSGTICEVNEALADAQISLQPPVSGGRRLKIYYATQQSVCPPTFVLFINNEELMHFAYQRYLENHFRKCFGFEGTPIRFILREKKQDGKN